MTHLTDELDDSTGLLDLLLSESRDVAGLDDNGNLGKTSLSEELGVSEGEEVDDGGDTVSGTGEVLLAGLSGDESPELFP
jgi:hypothetical protein